jgi:multidrug efflux pump subunit AcrA (membrane-fusion protein)
VAGASLLAAGCGRDEAASKETAPETAVAVTHPVERDLPRSIRVTGTLYGDEEATIAAKVAGRIVEVVKDLGDAATAGEALIVVDPTDYELARTERQLALSEALARLGLAELPEAPLDVGSLPSVEAARLRAENARAKYERARGLVKSQPPLISDQEFADVRTAYEVAQSELKVERLMAESTLAEARTLEAQVRIADQRVRDTIHRAPETGAGGTPEGIGEVTPPPAADHVYEVAERLVAVGDFVQVGVPLVRLVDADPLKLRVLVPERLLGRVVKEQTVRIFTEAHQSEFRGYVSRVSPAVDTRTRAFVVEVLVPNPERLFKPGSFATAEIEVGQERALLIPATAVVTFAGVHKVALVQAEKIAERQIEIGDRAGDMVEVKSGLTLDDVLVIAPAAGLATGTRVQVRETATGAVPTAAESADAGEAR